MVAFPSTRAPNIIVEVTKICFLFPKVSLRWSCPMKNSLYFPVYCCSWITIKFLCCRFLCYREICTFHKYRNFSQFFVCPYLYPVLHGWIENPINMVPVIFELVIADLKVYLKSQELDEFATSFFKAKLVKFGCICAVDISFLFRKDRTTAIYFVK